MSPEEDMLLEDYDGLISYAVSHVKRLLGEGKSLIILATPGSSRSEVTRRILEDIGGVEVYAYRGLYEKLEKQGYQAKKLEGLRINDEDLFKYLRGGRRLSDALNGRKIIIVPESTWHAVSFLNRLASELREELKDEADEASGKLAELIFLPGIYKERLEKLGKKLPQAVIVRYPVLGKNKEGVSLALLKMELKDVSIGIKAIRGLSPEENTGLRSLFKTYSRITALALIATPFAAVGGYFAGTVLAPLIEGVVLRSSLSEMLDTTRTFLNTVQKGGMGSIVEVLEKVLGGVVGRVTRRGRQRREFLNSMAELLKAAIKAKPYIDKPEYEGIVDEVAAKWGLDAASFKKFIDNLYTATTSRLVREEELRKLRELRDREFVERLGKIMEEKREPLLREFSEKLEGIWGELRKLDEKVKELEE